VSKRYAAVLVNPQSLGWNIGYHQLNIFPSIFDHIFVFEIVVHMPPFVIHKIAIKSILLWAMTYSFYCIKTINFYWVWVTPFLNIHDDKLKFFAIRCESCLIKHARNAGSFLGFFKDPWMRDMSGMGKAYNKTKWTIVQFGLTFYQLFLLQFCVLHQLGNILP